MRTTTLTVVFTRPFHLPGFEHSHLPGAFEVKTDEEPLDTFSEGWRRVATTIRLVDKGNVQVWPVEPADLDKALAADSAEGVAA